jgi:serine phosphatase RsbU (regulator of sigma subunit)
LARSPSPRKSEKAKGAAALLLEVRKKYNEIYEEAKGLRALINLSSNISAHLDLETILKGAMKSAVVLTRAERGYLVMREGEQLEIRSAVHIDPDMLDDESLNYSKSVVKHVLDSGEPILTMNAAEDDRFSDAKSIQTLDLRAIMAAPIKDAEDNAIGAIYVDDPMQEGRFNKRTVDLLEGFARQVSIAIETALLHKTLLENGIRKEQMETARQIQMALMPQESLEIPGIEIAWSYTPAMEVGGDLIQFLTLPDGRSGVLIADVAGKGTPAALVMTKMHEAAKLLGRTTGDVLDLMTAINDSLFEDLRRGSMVTASLAVFEKDGRHVSIIRAGHCPTGLVRAASGSLTWDEPKGLALGIVGPKWQAVTEESHIDLEDGDGLLFFTDGISEAMDPDHEEFGFERTKEYAEANAGKDARSFVDGLSGAVDEFVKGATQSDDITIVYVRRSTGT